MKTKTKRKGLLAHLATIGFTNRLAIYLMVLLGAGLAAGVWLAYMSIISGYLGQLLCFTVVFTPIGTCCSIVLNSIVQKSRAENVSGDGTGVKFAEAQANHFQHDYIYGADQPIPDPGAASGEETDFQDSPAI